MVIITGYGLNKEVHGSPLTVFFWRAVCDVGIGIRFLLPSEDGNYS